MAREDDIRKIVSGARARGLDDDQIRALVARYDARQNEAAPKSAPLRTGGGPAVDWIANTVAEPAAAWMREGPQRLVRGLTARGGLLAPPTPLAPGETIGSRLDTEAGELSNLGRSAALTAAPVALPAALASAPIATIVGVPVSMATGYLAGRGAEAMGAGPGATQLAEDVGGVAGGGTVAGLRRVPVRQSLATMTEKIAPFSTPISTVIGAVGGGKAGGPGGMLLGGFYGAEKGPHLERRLLRVARRLRGTDATGGGSGSPQAGSGSAALLEQLGQAPTVPDLSMRRGMDIVRRAQQEILSPEEFAAGVSRLKALGVPDAQIPYYLSNPAAAQGLINAGGVGRVPRP